MKRKPIKLQWDDLEAAFSNQNPELVYYLDVVTGYVVLEGEGEEDDDDDNDSTAIPVLQKPPYDATRIYIVPPDDALKLQWMKQFVDEVGDLEVEVRDKLKSALDEEDSVPAINDVLRQHPEGRDRWYLYRSDRKHELIDRWIVEHGIETVDPPPWK
jgi:hypothetical protein